MNTKDFVTIVTVANNEGNTYYLKDVTIDGKKIEGTLRLVVDNEYVTIKGNNSFKIGRRYKFIATKTMQADLVRPKATSHITLSDIVEVQQADVYSDLTAYFQ